LLPNGSLAVNLVRKLQEQAVEIPKEKFVAMARQLQNNIVMLDRAAKTIQEQMDAIEEMQDIIDSTERVQDRFELTFRFACEFLTEEQRLKVAKFLKDTEAII
jgi:hypothetical protein